jgi:hypothetical protein
MTLSEVTVEIPLNPDDRYIYKQSGAKSPSGEQLWGLSRPALDDIKEAAGIQIVDSRPTPGFPHEKNIISWQVTGRREHPDGFVQEEPATYVLDLTAPRFFDPDSEYNESSGRYSELYTGFYEDALEKLRDKKNIKWTPKPAARAAIHLKLEEEAGPEWVREQRMMAHRSAISQVSKWRSHISSRAETGAIHRLIRNMLGVKHSYTLTELKQGITLHRTQFNREKLNELPKELRIRLLTAEAGQAMGIDPGYLAALMPPEEDAAHEPEPVEDSPVSDYVEPEEPPDRENGDIIDGEYDVKDTEPETPSNGNGRDIGEVQAELKKALVSMGKEDTITDGKQRFMVQKVFEARGAGAPDWSGGGPTAGDVLGMLEAEASTDEAESK